jgi:alpha-L-rhamnosidase
MPADLCCEFTANPLGVETAEPRLSWLFTSASRDHRQSAYQILVAATKDDLAKDRGDKWDSGRVESSQSANVVYRGGKLSSGEACHWKVRIWDEAGKPSPWSEPAMFAMGLLTPADWTGEWIGQQNEGGLAYVDGKLNAVAAAPILAATSSIVVPSEMSAPDLSAAIACSIDNPECEACQ